MKIQIASDLHLERLTQIPSRECLIRPAPGAEVLVLAGDIDGSAWAISRFRNWPTPVLYVAGNHEFFFDDMYQVRCALRLQTKGSSIQYMDDDELILGDVRFLGTTLWTDYCLDGVGRQAETLASAQAEIMDHRRIYLGGHRFTPEQALIEHRKSCAWLSQKLDEPFDGKTVVISHHAPHPNSVHPDHVDDDLNGAFVSNLSNLLPKAAVWIHGHMHHSFDYLVEGCRVVANPAGYAANRLARSVDDFIFENKHFQREFVIEI